MIETSFQIFYIFEDLPDKFTIFSKLEDTLSIAKQTPEATTSDSTSPGVEDGAEADQPISSDHVLHRTATSELAPCRRRRADDEESPSTSSEELEQPAVFFMFSKNYVFLKKIAFF